MMLYWLVNVEVSMFMILLVRFYHEAGKVNFVDPPAMASAVVSRGDPETTQSCDSRVEDIPVWGQNIKKSWIRDKETKIEIHLHHLSGLTTKMQEAVAPVIIAFKTTVTWSRKKVSKWLKQHETTVMDTHRRIRIFVFRGLNTRRITRTMKKWMIYVQYVCLYLYMGRKQVVLSHGGCMLPHAAGSFFGKLGTEGPEIETLVCNMYWHVFTSFSQRRWSQIKLAFSPKTERRGFTQWVQHAHRVGTQTCAVTKWMQHWTIQRWPCWYWIAKIDHLSTWYILVYTGYN